MDPHPPWGLRSSRELVAPVDTLAVCGVERVCSKRVLVPARLSLFGEGLGRMPKRLSRSRPLKRLWEEPNDGETG